MLIRWISVPGESRLLKLFSSTPIFLSTETYFEDVYYIFISFFLTSLEMKEHCMEKKRDRRCKNHWGGQFEKERDMGLREMSVLSGTWKPTGLTSSSWPRTCPFHPRTRSSFSLWWSECQKKKLKAFFLFFLVGGNRRIISLCYHQCSSACMDAAAGHDHTTSSFITILMSESICPLRSRAPHGRSHFSVPVPPCSHPSSDL